jgi:hypothetical protein
LNCLKLKMIIINRSNQTSISCFGHRKMASSWMLVSTSSSV